MYTLDNWVSSGTKRQFIALSRSTLALFEGLQTPVITLAGHFSTLCVHRFVKEITGLNDIFIYLIPCQLVVRV
jgi:hypothetical protein